MNAKEMREIADKNRALLDTENYKHVLQIIREAASKGHHHIEIKPALNKYYSDKLKDAGFTVQFHSLSGRQTIRW